MTIAHDHVISIFYRHQDTAHIVPHNNSTYDYIMGNCINKKDVLI